MVDGNVTRTALLVVTVALVVPAMAGCVGGDGGAPGPASEATGGNETATTNGTGSDAGQRPHVHDRWTNPATGEGNLSEIVLVETQLTIDPVNDSRPLLVEPCGQSRGFQNARTCLGWAEFTPGSWSNGKAKIVPPATDRVEITLTFSSDAFAGIDLYFKDRTSQGQWKMLTNASNDGPFEPGGETKTIPVGPRMRDDGHAEVSAWRFGIAPWGDPGTGGATGLVDVGRGEVEATVVAYRAEGPLPFEPPHPQFWDRDDPPTHVYRIGTLEGSTDGYAQAGRATWEPGSGSSPKLSGQGLVWEISPGFRGQRMSDTDVPTKLEGRYDDALVPPGARMIVVQVAISEAEARGDVQICVRGRDVPGEGFSRSVTLGECRDFGDGEFTIEEVLKGGQTDSYYVNRSSGISESRWTFYVQVRAGDLAGHPSAASFSGTVEADIFVTDRTRFETPTWADGSGNQTA